MSPVVKSDIIMEVNVVMTGKKSDGSFWHLCSSVGEGGFIKSGLFSNIKDLKVGKHTIPAEVFNGMKWTY